MDVGDDDIAIKSGPINSPGPDNPSRDIIITDCTFLHGHGLSIGSEIAGGAQNIRAERIHFEGADNGIRVKANRDRGNDVGHFLFRDIVIENATAMGSVVAGVIVGLPESPIPGVVLRNVKIGAQHGLTIGYADVSGTGAEIKTAEGGAITKLASAKVDLR